MEELPPQPAMKSNLDLINECDAFPYYQTDPEVYLQHISTYYHFQIANSSSTLGYVLPSVAEVLRGLSSWTLDDDTRTLTLDSGSTAEERSAIIAATCEAMRKIDHFRVLRGWRNELYPVYAAGGELLFSIERAASSLFGIVTYGVHMTAFVRGKEAGALKIWVPRRARNKQTYGGMLDNTVAGGISTGEATFESLVREAAEEASLPEELVRREARACGCVTYFYIRDARAGGETGLLQPECEYIYDLELDEDVVPRPGDSEVEEFYLWTVQEVQEAMARGEFKPNCAMVLLDFFMRHGILTCENEKDYVEIVARLHRRLEFPTH
ncbi:hypothetical protein B0A49_05880 [Cryomyces minteri]|uniref:Nudix hydrolase domain-containing protein n=1 Tax=Cryomyces minteri TaxID=331657 RepID=A0A4V5NF59_9PEZI|nr:hypothetical protein B0A49_05880 [Cryomyces minteri]